MHKHKVSMLAMLNIYFLALIANYFHCFIAIFEPITQN